MTRLKLRASLVAAAFASAVAPVLAAEVIETYNLEPVTTRYVVPRTTTYYVAPDTADHYYAPRATYYTPSYTVREVYESPAIIVEAPSLTTDQRINNDVIDTLASNPRLSGRIGVETYDRGVELTGVVTNPRQAELAERDARSVYGVREVQNELRTRLSR